MNFTKQTITISCQCPSDHSKIDAYVAPNGLGYHLSHYGDHNGPDWTVTHLKSGKTLGPDAGHFESEGQCRSFIARVSDLHDWTSEYAPNEETQEEIGSIALDCQCFEITYL